MGSRDESGINEKLENLSDEICKIEVALKSFKKLYEDKYGKYSDSLTGLVNDFKHGNPGLYTTKVPLFLCGFDCHC